MNQIQIPKQMVIILVVLLFILGGGYYYVSNVLSANDYALENIKDDSQQIGAYVPATGRSFVITNTLEGEDQYKIFATKEAKNYSAQVTSGGSSWRLAYVSPMLCFKKDVYAYTYCVNERVVGINIIQNLFGMMNANNQTAQVTNEEKIAASATPLNSLMKFLTFTEAAMKDMQTNPNTEDHPLYLETEGNSISIGQVTGIRADESTIEIPEGSLDWVRLANVLNEKTKDSGEITIADLDLENSPEGDVLVVELMKAYELNPEDYMLR